MPLERQQGRLVAVALGMVVCLTIAMAVERHLYNGVGASVQWVTHTLEVQRQFDLLLVTVTDAETGQRGFLLVHDPTYLEPYQMAVARVDSLLSGLRRLTADNESQQARLAHLATLIGAKLAELRETVDLAARGQNDAAMNIVASNRGRDMMDSIRTAVRGGVADEQLLLARRNSVLRGNIEQREYWTWGLAALNVAVVLALLSTMRRVEQLRPLVTVCAWSKTIQFENEWISFEEYLWRRFQIRASHGISPEQAALLRVHADGRQPGDRR